MFSHCFSKCITFLYLLSSLSQDLSIGDERKNDKRRRHQDMQDEQSDSEGDADEDLYEVDGRPICRGI